MAIAPGFDYDVFVSYAHTDDADGWITQLIRRLEPVLRQRLGIAETPKIFIDQQATGPNTHLPELLTAVKRSALFLAVGSPSYTYHEWTRMELSTFMQGAPDLSRLFMIECLPLSGDDRYPPPLDEKIRLAFWKPGVHQHISMPLSANTDSELFSELVHSLAARIRDQLLSLRVLSGGTPKPTPNLLDTRDPPVTDATSGVLRKTVLLAQTTEDVEDEADLLRRFLAQYESEVRVLPATGYPQGGGSFRAAFSQDLAKADLFIQLLGRRPGRFPPDLPEGYIRCQSDAARASGVQIFEWRHPDLDIQSVADPVYRQMLAAETVIVSGFEAFKQQVLNWVRKPVPKPRATRSSTVFINADDKGFWYREGDRARVLEERFDDHSAHVGTFVRSNPPGSGREPDPLRSARLHLRRHHARLDSEPAQVLQQGQGEARIRAGTACNHLRTSAETGDWDQHS